MAKTYSAGVATAYGAAVRGGYTGTYEDFCKDQAEFAENAQQVATDRAAVQAIASTFENTTVPNATAAIQAEGQAQIVNVIGAGNTQIAAVNNTATTQIQNIQAEGTAQVGRVQIAVTAQVDRAESAANDASEYASTASASKNAAQASETNAANSATAAAASATAAADSATTANTKAGEAASFATAAADSATDAVAAKTAAETAQGKAETAQGEAETAAQSVSASAAQITQNAEDIGDLRSALSFYNFGLFDGRIDWDTTNNTVTLGAGYFIYGGSYTRISSATTLAYTNFNNTTVLVYNGSAFSFVPFNGLVNGTALALFNVNKMYMPFSYDKVYLNGNKITTANLFNDFVPFVDSIAQDVDDISPEVEAISNKLDVLFPETTIYNENNSPRSTATNDSIWIPKELTIPANSLVTTIDVYTNDNTQKTFSISFWNNNTGEKYAEKTYTLTPSQYVVSIPINTQTTSPTKIGFYSASGFATVTGKNGYNLLYVEPSATSILNASTLAKWALNATIKAIVVNQDGTRVLSQEIHVGEGLAYTEIQQAIEAVTGDYATIIVHPKSTPYGRFSLMRSLSDSYPWSGLASVKHISIIGVDKTKCIVQSNTGNYNTPPAEIATNGVIKNLTFIATHTASDGTETTGSYAVHVDNRPADANGMKLVFENCDFISYQTAAVGLGLYRNQDITFDRCNFKSITDTTWKPNENYDSTYMCALGAYFMHTTMGFAGGNMFIRFWGCFFYHEGGSYAMRIADADETQTALLEAINNTLWDATNGNTGYYTTNNPIMQMPYNHGNNAAGLNA